MLQHINLYLLFPEQKKSFLTLRLMAFSYGAFVLLLALHFCVEWWGKHRETQQVQALTLEVNQVGQRLAQIHQQYPMLDLKDMETSLRHLQEELDEKNRIFNLVFGNQNFSNDLLGVAKAAVSDVWLVDIQATTDDKGLIFKGYALQASAVQEFLNRLALQKEFAGLNFQLQEMKQEELHKEPVLHFIISTQEAHESQV